MSVQYPVMLVVAPLVGVGLVLGYRWLQRQRTAALAGTALAPGADGWARWRRHGPGHS